MQVKLKHPRTPRVLVDRQPPALALAAIVSNPNLTTLRGGGTASEACRPAVSVAALGLRADRSTLGSWRWSPRRVIA
jgi:hypothetical protein